jgi:hypothetical protein
MLLRGSLALFLGGWIPAASACGGDTSIPGSSGGSGAGAGGSAGADICSLPQEVGNCRGLIPRFWFNAATGRCEAFTYGGCGGNANNFESPAACVEACAPGTINACSKTDCAQGAACVFVATRPAACLVSCADPGACPPSMTCECGGSCAGCENCIQVCVPL